MTASLRPVGSVTLMFTDIEGSTKLLERLRERYALVLEQQRDILRALQSILWDAVTGRVIGELPDTYVFGFSADGRQVAGSSNGGALIVWEVSVDAWQAAACHVANRNLSQTEWQRYLGDEPYHETCATPSLP